MTFGTGTARYKCIHMMRDGEQQHMIVTATRLLILYCKISSLLRTEHASDFVGTCVCMKKKGVMSNLPVSMNSSDDSCDRGPVVGVTSTCAVLSGKVVKRACFGIRDMYDHLMVIDRGETSENFACMSRCCRY